MKKFLDKMLLQLRFEGDRIAYPDTFQRELDYQSSRVLTFASLITLGWLPYIPIDRALFPDEPLIVVLRVLFPVIGITIYFLRFFDYFKDKNLVLLTLYGAYLMISTGVLTGLTGGDPAYIGGYIFILTLIVVAPVRRKHAYLILALSLFAFFAIGYHKGLRFDSLRARYSINDVAAAAVVTSCFIYILDGIRFMSWKKSKTIELSQVVITKQRDQLEDQINLAGEIQKKLLPHRLPDVENASVVFAYHPMMGVGGDFVDIHYAWDRKELGLFICDVSGHGVAAAFISSMVKMALSGWSEHLDRPSEMLHSVYDALKGKISAQFVTASICFIDLKTGLLRIASAGHPPVIVLRRNGAPELFKPKGKIINDMMPPNYVDIETRLEKHDKIILYTDGITESISEGNAMFGDEGLIDIIGRMKMLPPGEICSGIMEELAVFVGKEPFRDDITIMVMEFLADAAEEERPLENLVL